MVDLHRMPVGRFSPQDKDSFAWVTLVKRWPVIITNIVSTVSNELHQLHMAGNNDAKVAEGKGIIAKLSEIKHDMGRNGLLHPIEEDGGNNVACYNDELDSFDDTDRRWSTMNWLFAECYLYRRIRNFFALTQHWKEYDPFFESKAETYKSSSAAIVHLAKALNSIVGKANLADNYEAPGSALEIAFLEMIQADLWGNATDLSLLVDLKYEDIQKLQAVGAEAQAEQAKMILRNDLPKVWDHLKTLQGARMDFVLDNAGFELYTDFVLADFFVSCTPFVSEVIFHPKDIPWFVSDVLPYDFTWAIDSLLDTKFFSQHAQVPLTDSDTTALTVLAQRWKGHIESGKFKLSVPLDTRLGGNEATKRGSFWTTQYAYQDMPAIEPELVEELAASGLVIFKGDLNYRKLLGDGKWPVNTSFDEVLGPLAGTMNILSLRTNKADTIAGLPGDFDEAAMSAKAKDWRVSGKYAVVSFSPKRA